MDRVRRRRTDRGRLAQSILSNQARGDRVESTPRTLRPPPSPQRVPPIYLTRPHIRRWPWRTRGRPRGRYGEGLAREGKIWPTVRDRVLPGVDVRAALASVESGAAQAGIVYRTAARISKKVRVVFEVAARRGTKIAYVLGVLKQRRTPRGPPLRRPPRVWSRRGRLFERFRLRRPEENSSARLGVFTPARSRSCSSRCASRACATLLVAPLPWPPAGRSRASASAAGAFAEDARRPALVSPDRVGYLLLGCSAARPPRRALAGVRPRPPLTGAPPSSPPRSSPSRSRRARRERPSKASTRASRRWVRRSGSAAGASSTITLPLARRGCGPRVALALGGSGRVRRDPSSVARQHPGQGPRPLALAIFSDIQLGRNGPRAWRSSG